MTDKKRGTLYGLAIGDALGAPIEFQSPGYFPIVDGYRGGGPFHLQPGEWTDDTSMALALADSLKGKFDPNDQMDKYLDWWENGNYSVNGKCFDIGTTTSRSLQRYKENRNWMLSGDPDPRLSGNGCIMRLAPVPIKYSTLIIDSPEDLANLARDSSHTTHPNVMCFGSCVYMALVIAGLIEGLDREEVLAPDWEPVQEIRSYVPVELREVFEGSYRTSFPPHIQGSGYVVKCLEAALWAFHNADSFEDAVLKAVNLGDDADTTGAVCGQFAGAYWGYSGIPQQLIDGLARKDMIEKALSGII